MNHNQQHDNLAQLGEELLKEFEAAEKTPVPDGFHSHWRQSLRRRKRPVLQAIRWTAAAAVMAFALVGVLTVTVLTSERLRTPLLQFAAAHFVPEEPEEFPEYRQISSVDGENMALTVYFDGVDSYQLLLGNEMGLRQYNITAPELDEDFFRDLGEQLLEAKD